MEPLEPMPSLHNNGALDPNAWSPSYDNLRNHARYSPPEEGDLVGWRYGGWRVVEVAPVPEVDLSEKEREQLDAFVSGLRKENRPAQWMRNRPYRIVLRHETGPAILNKGEPSQKLHDGATTVHFRIRPLRRSHFPVVAEPFKACSCHGHIWPCQEIDQAALAAHQARKMDRLMATADPGVCAHCLEPISTRQKSLTFPEPSRFVPGAPGPTFHAGRAACWGAAEEYERTGRLADNPEVARLASCPGIRFLHESTRLRAEQRLECTASPFCTGHHGPSGYRQDAPCWHQVQLAGNEGAYARPGFDCGYATTVRRCLGGDMSSGGTSISPTAADILWDASHRRRSGGGPS